MHRLSLQITQETFMSVAWRRELMAGTQEWEGRGSLYTLQYLLILYQVNVLSNQK